MNVTFISGTVGLLFIGTMWGLQVAFFAVSISNYTDDPNSAWIAGAALGFVTALFFSVAIKFSKRIHSA